MDSPLPAISLLLFSLFSAAYSSTLGVQYISKLLQIQDRERAPPALQIAAARAVLHRLLPSHSSAFEFRIISKEKCGGEGACFIINNHPSSYKYGAPEILWGGPLPESWFHEQLTLQKKILARMYELGMTPEYGRTSHIYNCDTFDENTPPVDDPGYISSLGAAIFSGMQSGDENATWLMQGWLFSYDPFWRPPQMKDTKLQKLS
ncbi:hypothetical protein V6N12_013265 [Hibiscus sabdariffa]|uniref:Alpha-N-acetylglucosaminidase tim-barrel domain-containing protein n=1 Tax=Hibiscus sabdariffa TaxID=183260 RepID=A0ABR2D609_9ROSI